MAVKLVSLVTGASSGIGKAIAKQLIADGQTVITTGRSTDRLEDLSVLGAHVVRLDVSLKFPPVSLRS